MADDLESCSDQPALSKWRIRLILCLALALAAFHIYTAWAGVLSAYLQRGTHLIGLLILGFLSVAPKTRVQSFVDLSLALLCIAACLYFFQAWDPSLVLNRGIVGPSTLDFLFGVLLLLLVLEGTRRAIGAPIVLVALGFLAYGFFGSSMPDFISHKGYSLERMTEYLIWSTNGVFGKPLAVSATFVIIFIIFGSLLQTLGAGKLFIDLSVAVTGRIRGGPALTSVLASALMGSISGSSVSNVVTTGAFTIPLMERTGYRKNFAAGVEAVASTGGQIMPPVMGAGAFVMAELLGLPYSDIVLAALVPAMLYFVSIALMVYFEAHRYGIDARPDVDKPRPVQILRERGHLLIPLAVLLICLVVLRFSPTMSGLFGVLSLVLVASVAQLFREGRIPIRETIEGLRSGVIIAIPVALACATAGIVIGVVSQTGLGVRFTQLILELSNGNLWLAALLTMAACIVLGMGLPTTAAYIITAVLGAPTLVHLGVPLIAAHMFIFYFAIVSFITPPVGLSAYAAAGIAGSNPFTTGLTSFKLGLAGFIVPFAFIYAPELLLIGDATGILLSATTALAGIVSLAAALIGWFLVPLAPAWRIVLFASSLAMISPELSVSIFGLLILVTIAMMAYLRDRRHAGQK